MNAYCARWKMLQKGVSVEHQVRGLILRVAYQLSQTQGIRSNPYFPALDIDNVDMRLHLEAVDGTWAIDIEVSVRSSSRPSIALGRETQYGTLSRWLKRSRDRKTPCLFFQYDWLTSKLFVFTPAMLRALGAENSKMSISLPLTSGQIEEQLYTILSTIAASPSEAEARNLLT